MKIGVCCGANRWQLLREIGYDFAEGNFAELTLCAEERFHELCEAQKNAQISVESFNGFFPPQISLYEHEQAKTERIVTEFAEKGFARAKALGGEIAVLGAGRARNIPKGMEKSEAEERFLSVLRLLGDIALKNGMRLAVEPLQYAESNFLNTVSEGLDISRRSGHDSVGMIVDFYHFYCNGESLDSLRDTGSHLFHAHLARPNIDRKAPTAADAEACRPFARALHDMGYAGRISLEARFGDDFAGDIKAAYDVMCMFR